MAIQRQPAFDNSPIAVRKAKPEDASVCGRICYEAFTKISTDHTGWALRVSVYSRVRIISLGTNGQSSDQRSLLVISTHSGGDETYTSQNARCVGHPARNRTPRVFMMLGEVVHPPWNQIDHCEDGSSAPA